MIFKAHLCWNNFNWLQLAQATYKIFSLTDALFSHQMLPKTGLPVVSHKITGRHFAFDPSIQKKKISLRKNSLVSQITKLIMGFRHSKDLPTRQLYLYVLSFEKSLTLKQTNQPTNSVPYDKMRHKIHGKHNKK